jgi:hypothetical protein
MNSQTRTIMIASLAGLGLAVLIQASNVMSTGHITPLPTFNPFNEEALYYWIGALGFVPLFFIVIATAATARKAGLRNSIFNGLAAIVGVLLLIIGAVVAVATAFSG